MEIRLVNYKRKSSLIQTDENYLVSQGQVNYLHFNRAKHVL